MKRLGVIARGDNGGLGNLTWEFCRHLQPDRVLLMDLGEFGRSQCHPERFEGLDVRVAHGFGPSRLDVEWLLDGCDVLYSAETWYDNDLPLEAKRRSIKTILHVMPELFVGQTADEIWIPTTYRRSMLPNARLVPVPIALDRFEHRVRTPAKHFVHVWAPAMLDRNGTWPTLAALEAVNVPVTVTIIGAQSPMELERRNSPVTLRSVPGPYPRDYWDIWPPDADVLLLPRRFAGLSMPVQEAAAAGIPAVMTGVPPQADWPGVYPVSFRGRQAHVMAGGRVDVYDPDPSAITAAIEQLASDPEIARTYSLKARGWAEGLSWDLWTSRYRGLLGV